MLGQFVPAFGHIVAMMQFNMYHHYTVDEHLLRCIGVLSDIEAGRSEDTKFTNELMRTILPQHRTLLYVALFLHDIAKGRIEDHSIAGARVARALCPRLGFSPADTETVAWLIEVHLVMSSVAQSRDLSDRVTIENFAAVVQSVERMKLLTILTTADIKAVGPGVWNGWKSQLIRTLYYETEPVLTGGFSEVNRAQRVALAQAEFRAELKDWTPAELDAYITLHYPAYWLKVDLAHKVAHARFMREVAQGSGSLSTTVIFPEARGVTELTVLAPDHPWLLSIIAGACSMAGANIVDAQIFTTTDGRALDTIALSREFDRDDDEARRAARITVGDRKGAARRTQAAGSRRPARGGQGPPQGLRPRPHRDDQQSMVESLHHGRSDRARPAGSAVRADRDLVQAQPQYRLGSHRDVRRAGGGRVLRHRPVRGEDHVGDAPGRDQAGAHFVVRAAGPGGKERGEAGPKRRRGVSASRR